MAIKGITDDFGFKKIVKFNHCLMDNQKLY